jgi:deoxyribonuclease-1-like protein
MISRLFKMLLLVGLAVGGFYFFSNFKIQGIDNLSVKSRGAKTEAPKRVATKAAEPVVEQQADAPPVAAREIRDPIRIATVNLGPLDQQKLGNWGVSRRLVRLIQSFAIVAIQDVRDRNQSVLAKLVDKVNGRSGQYDFVVPTYLGREPVQRYSAFVFDGSVVEIDRSKVYSIEDPHSRLLQRPLVASFRTRGPRPAEAFTFTLINVHVDTTRAATEVDVLADVFRVVRDDSYGEDDVILLGDLESNVENLGQLALIPNLTWAISGISTTTRGTRLVDNLLFDARSTSEFTGRSGVMDLMAEFEVSMREAIEISDHLPVWAEFDVYEGGRAGHMAGIQPAEVE